MKLQLKLMRRAALPLLLSASALFSAIHSASAQGNAFTYQGRLSDNGGPANGAYDFRFKLFTDSAGNNQTGGTVLTNGILVTSGLFTTTIDFGPGIFNGANVWLEISVRTNGGASYSPLSPLQPLMPTPYAMFAEGASNVLGTVSSAGLSGSYSGQVTFGDSGNSFSGSFTGNGGGLTNVNAATLGGVGPNGFWRTSGNNGTTAGVNFIGTTDNQPLELRVAGQRALRLEIIGPEAPNVIGGFSNNFVGPTLSGATIAGGGLSAAANRIVGAGFNGAIGGGRNNVVSNFNGTISGGANNASIGNAASVGGGSENIAGGDHDVVAGGQLNKSIGYHSFIAGGLNNTNAGLFAAIGGGEKILIGDAADHATIAGGFGNTVFGSDGPVSDTISGGNGNTIQADTAFATIGGGIANLIQTASHSGTIGGGTNNVIQGSSTNSIIAGGVNNLIGPFAHETVISGGQNNTNNGFGCTIGGGIFNSISNVYYATVSGGDFNRANGYGSVVSGGNGNVANATYATIPGGFNVTASGSFSFAAGRQAQALQDGAFVWADSQIGPYSSDRADQFKIRARGGMVLDVSGSSGLNPAALLINSTAANGVGMYIVETSSDASFVVNNAGTGTIIKGFNGGGSPVFEVVHDGTVYSKGIALTSDRNAKENFTAINAADVLDKVASLPISAWNFKTDSAEQKHLGPMAQDFHAAFGLNGSDDKHISAVDEGGVALAAIQGLNQRLKEKETEIQTLRQRLEKLEQLLNQKRGDAR